MRIDPKTLTLQQDQSDCGVACLLTIVQFHGGHNHLEHPRKLSGTSRHGTTLLGLLQAAQQLGFEAHKKHFSQKYPICGGGLDFGIFGWLFSSRFAALARMANKTTVPDGVLG